MRSFSLIIWLLFDVVQWKQHGHLDITVRSFFSNNLTSLWSCPVTKPRGLDKGKFSRMESNSLEQSATDKKLFVAVFNFPGLYLQISIFNLRENQQRKNSCISSPSKLPGGFFPPRGYFPLSLGGKYLCRRKWRNSGGYPHLLFMELSYILPIKYYCFCLCLCTFCLCSFL